MDETQVFGRHALVHARYAISTLIHHSINSSVDPTVRPVGRLIDRSINRAIDWSVSVLSVVGWLVYCFMG